MVVRSDAYSSMGGVSGIEGCWESGGGWGRSGGGKVWEGVLVEWIENGHFV